MSRILSQARAILSDFEAGKISESLATARLQVAMAKHDAKARKQSDNSLLPAEVRMGCSKKGYSRPHAGCTSGSQI